MEAVECGAASLAMVLAHHGRYVPLEELRIACGVTRNGTNAAAVLKAARHYGLKGKGFSKEPLALRTIRTPAIIHWNFNHFLVLEGFGRDRVYLNDPAMDPRTVTFEELDTAFTGVVLIFQPTETFDKGGERPSVFAGLRRGFAGSEVAIAYALIAGLLLVLPALAIPTFTRVFVDTYLVGGFKDWLVPLLLGLALTGALRALLRRTRPTRDTPASRSTASQLA
jgi:ABC-type bacteriocin/lantibiotic exporter with double-glycine peptidase domain